MGSNTDFRTYANFTKEEAEKRFRSDQNQSSHEDGHSYSGCIGVMPGGINWVPKTFSSAQEAADYITENHEKWDAAMGTEYTQVVEEDVPKETHGFVIGGWCSS